MIIMERDRGILFVLVGPGGAGKNALMRAVIARNENLSQLATATTRPRRQEEKQGREHHFVDKAEFKRMIDANELLEYQEVTADKWYGIPRFSIDPILNQGHDLIADIEVLGAQILRDTYPDDVVLIFITVPGDTIEDKLTVLSRRMNNGHRKENPELIQERLERARSLELPFAEQCDFVIVNDEIDAAIEELQTIITAERIRNNN